MAVRAKDPPLARRVLDDERVRAIEPVLLGFARRAVRDPDVARDLVQETMLSALMNRASFDGRSSLRTWLVGILSHKIVDHFRRIGRALQLEQSDPEDLLASPPRESPEDVLARHEAIAVLERAIGELPELERLATLLVDVEDVGRMAACNILAVQPTYLRVLLYRARHRLRRALENAGAVPSRP